MRGKGAEAVQSGPAAIESLLPAVVHALGVELRMPIDGLTAVSSSARSYSSVWELHGGGGHYILKWLPRRAGRELELTRLSRDLFAGMPHIRTPGVACCPTPDTFLVEKLPGVALQALCTRPPLVGLSRWLHHQTEVCARVGSWLRAFHDASLTPEPAALAGVKAYMLARESVFGALDRGLLELLLHAIDTGVTRSTVRVHGDFTPHNVLVAGDVVAVIDLAGINEFEREAPAFDAAAMVVGLEEAWRGRRRNYLRYAGWPVRSMIAGFLQKAGEAAADEAFAICYAVRHFTRIGNLYRRTGRRPGARSFHVRRLRLALERPDAIRSLATAAAGA